MLLFSRSKFSLSFLAQGNLVAVKRLAKKSVDLTRTVLMELKQVINHKNYVRYALQSRIYMNPFINSIHSGHLK